MNSLRSIVLGKFSEFNILLKFFNKFGKVPFIEKKNKIMIKNKYQALAQKILSLANIKINGSHPWDIQIHNNNLYSRFFSQGSLGLGEAYMDGWWDVKRLDQFFNRIFKAGVDKKVPLNLQTVLSLVKLKLFNLQTKTGSRKVIEKHYDLGNEIYTYFLDPYNQYTCGYFKNTSDLNTAQRQKLDLICKKLQLSSKDKVLDIGCGWGGFARFATEHYGCKVMGITISDEQVNYAKEFTKGLPVTIKKLDYRELTGSFDKILICGMLEHVGEKNYRRIAQVVHKCLKENGLFLLHTMGVNVSRAFDPWVDKYIFPNSKIPSPQLITRAIEGLFMIEDWHNFGAYYYPTLMAWFKNFDHNWNKIRLVIRKMNQMPEERFYRMWKYYLLSFAGGFLSRNLQLWQIVLSKNGVPGGYQPIR